MEAPAQFGVYFAVLRKHLLLLGVSAALVVASGVIYVVRQQPVFLSSATLVIETPQRNLASGTDYGAVLAQEQDDLQTQVLLLKQDPRLAAQAVEKLKSQHVDVSAGDYTETSLPKNVKVEFITGTRAVSFSLTGPDRDSLPAAVNAYAQVFQESSEGESARRFDLQEEQLKKDASGAAADLDALQKQQRELVKKHEDLNLANDENTADLALQTLLSKVSARETEHDADVAMRSLILDALARAGIAAKETGGRYEFEVKDGAGGAVADRLVADQRVEALKCVEASNAVGRAFKQESVAGERERALKESDVKEDSAGRKAARAEVEAALRRCGAAIVEAVATELNAIDGRLTEFVKDRDSVKEYQTKAAVVHGLRQDYRDLQNKIELQHRRVDLADAELKKLQTSYLRDPLDAAGGVRHATRRIVMKTPAAPPAEQIAPKVPLIIGLTAFAALAVGLGLVLLFEYLDDTIKSKEDFDRYVGLPFLGFIPRIDGTDSSNPDVAADARSGSAVAEAFRAVRTSILFSRSDKPVRTILVTSAGPGEGKTTVATNLAITLAQHKGPVLLVDADLRRPRVAKALGIENKIGLTNYLIGEATLDQVVQKTSIEGVFAITSGPIPPNPAELLHGERLALLLKSGLERFDRIVIDSPPVIAVSDARVIARCTDGLYLVISMGKTSWRLIQRSLESLTSIGFDVHGAILNNLSAPTGRYGYYYYRDYEYGKGYYQQQQQQPAPKP